MVSGAPPSSGRVEGTHGAVNVAQELLREAAVEPLVHRRGFGVARQALGSQQWARKVMAAKSIGGAAAVAGDALALHAPKLAAALMAELPGRLWDGKQALLEALAALAKGCPQEMDQGQVTAAPTPARAKSSATACVLQFYHYGHDWRSPFVSVRGPHFVEMNRFCSSGVDIGGSRRENIPA